MIKKYIKKIKHHFYDNEYGLQNLVVITGQKCTLHCKNCSNFSPYHSSKLDFYNANDIINDLENITKRIKWLDHMQLQGGDFFLHKDAGKILEYTAKNDKITRCTIATNCIILPKQEFLDIIKNPKFTVRISNYETTNEINMDKLIDLLKKNNINYTFHRYAKKDYSWSYLGGIDTLKQSKKDTLKNYEDCIFKVCLTIENGIISRCSRATVAHYVQKFIPKRKDFINVRSPFFSIHDLKKFWKSHSSSSKGIVTACYYCYGTSGQSVRPGEQLAKEEYMKIKRSENDR